MLSPVLIAPPAATPVDLATAKAHLRVETSAEDTLIASIIATATEHLDGRTGILARALITQDWRQDFADFACLRLPLAPVQSVVSLKYFDQAGAEQTVDPGTYVLRTDALGPYVALAPATTAVNPAWPSGLQSRPDAVRVTFRAGYGNAPANVPAPIRQAILLMAGAYYEHREELITGTIVNPLPAGVAAHALLAPFRRNLL